MGNPFGISFPRLFKPDAFTADVTPGNLKRWVTTLKQHELGESTRQLYERLKMTNRVELAPRVRFDWLDSLNEPLQIIVAGLRAHYQNKPFPLSEKAMAVAQLANALHEEMILAYRRILSSPPDTSLLGRSNDRSMRQIACYRLFAHAGEMLSNYQMMYTPAPPGMWRHLHAYYGRIRSQGWADTPISGVAAPATIEYLYRKALLLALVPAQLVPVREWQKIEGNIDTWVARLPLLDARQRTSAHAQYCIRFELDAPIAGVTDKCCSACNTRVSGVLLDTAPLITELEHYLASNTEVSKTDSDEKRLAPETIQMLLRAWRIPEAPREARTPVDLPLTIVSGLDNIHAILADEPRTHSASRGEGTDAAALNIRVPDLTLAEVKSRPVLSAFPEETFLGQRDQGEDVWAPSYGKERFVEPPRAWFDTPRKHTVDTLTARAVDASATGYRLEMELPEKSTLRLGELIALRGTSAAGWELFLLRWVRRIDSERVTLGLERIGDGLRAIDLIAQGSDSTRAVLHAVTALDEEMTPLLLMPTLPSLARKRLTIRHAGEETAITLADNLALSPLFESYAYGASEALTELEAWMQATQKSRTSGKTADHFDEVWSLL